MFIRFLVTLCVVPILSGSLSACDHAVDTAPREAALAQTVAPATPLAPAPSEVQQWAAQQTGAPAHLARTDTPAQPSEAASDALLPPVIHEVE